KDAFLAALSHELRTPLTPVLLSISSLESDPVVPESAREELTTLRRNIELEVQLIDDLLDLTRIVRGKIMLNPGHIDVHAAMNSAIDICRSDLSAKRLKLVQDYGATDAFTRGDAVRVQQILWNLLRNAIKFTPQGGCVTIESRDHGDGQIVLAISDTGIGIEP